jgi:hypothetical protein
LLQSAAGKVWETTIPSAQLQEFTSRHVISGTTRTSEGVRVRFVTDDSTVTGASSVTPTLEDAYLYLLASRRDEAS